MTRSTVVKVSIVLPVYNVARHLRGCLDSIGRQTFRDFEVIAVDDGSTDGSGRMLDDYPAPFPFRRIHQTNQGLSAARNAALAVAAGEYVLMVDSDDRIHPRLLELTVAAAKTSKLDFVVFDYRRIPEGKVPDVSDEWSADRTDVEPRELAVPAFDWFVDERRWPCACQFLYRRTSLAGRTFVPGILYEDIPFVLPYLADPVRGAYLAKELYCYAVAEGSITNKKNHVRRMAGYETGLRILKDKLDAVRYRNFIRRDFAAWLRGLWRDVHGLAKSDGRAEQVTALRAFLRRAFADGLLAWGDFRLLWRIRYAGAVWRAKGDAS